MSVHSLSAKTMGFIGHLSQNSSRARASASDKQPNPYLAGFRATRTSFRFVFSSSLRVIPMQPGSGHFPADKIQNKNKKIGNLQLPQRFISALVHCLPQLSQTLLYAVGTMPPGKATANGISSRART
jgi:hypothetical protein